MSEIDTAIADVKSAEESVAYFRRELENRERSLKYCKNRLRRERQRLIPRGRDESPIKYYKRTECVDDNYTRKHKGFYYCNPAHCSHKWTSKKERDAHLTCAYGALG